MSDAATAAEPKVIKRYTNRKLYDTVESRYVTLDEIAEMVKQGVEVKIVDNRTKEDLTSVTLAQIVFEEEKKKSQMPLSVLREIIRRPGESLTDFLKTEVGPRVESFREEAQSRIDKLLRRDEKEGGEKPAEAQAPGSGASLSPAELLKSSQRAVEEFQKRMDERVRTVVENVVGNLPALGRDLTVLLQRLDALEKKVGELEGKKR
ncbi:MAG: polyhydroxyalkanoate synthesis regulator DNA-binding domain-containing protein [Myxococcaceae bacterium]|nr:polyhydroxyalkanoate synthesis regulator DNA-binding domain-containing protein [Myxococcaceae bacterium]